MFLNSLAKTFVTQQSRFQQPLLHQAMPLVQTAMRDFTGKTESGFKFKTPKLRMRVVHPVFPPPGLDLKIPEGLTPEKYCA